MSIFTYHLVKTSFFKALQITFFPPKLMNIKGLIHMECMTFMTLGSQVFSSSRFFNRRVIVFAQWENESVIDRFLENDPLGKTLSKGWHTRLSYLRQWGKLDGFIIPAESIEQVHDEDSVVAVTIARMKLFQVPRFIRWGRPVEKLVRDHPGITLALASIRLPRTVSTFSIWKTQKEMTDMVNGHSKVQDPKRHSNAMKERNRKDFHIQFTTLRFKPISEYGEWDGRKNIIPNLNKTK
ncbi:hypothetical protein [Fluviicola taffensis]|uniref:Spheroidene monooxygenase n=1 Tax=Fluviicola taffensis (strain DSM 16823 / NCIMB 13979 / RW262) TaxID=755732 RepID=F2IE10_FLUTR|nr:hypothetical protein [Fluviicola taffensis]AEA45574.1 hypothetical protein Fluta_3605 [Fluviicola taffensis DSM 16823]